MSKKNQRTVADTKVTKADFLVQLKKMGVTLQEEDLQFLTENGKLEAVTSDEEIEGVEVVVRFNPEGHDITSPEIWADSHIIIAEAQEGDKKLDFVTTHTLQSYEAHLKSLDVRFGLNFEITKKDWMPESIEIHSPEFRKWIDSINADDGFWNSCYYHKFALYVQQAQQWLREFQQPDEDNETFRRREFDRRAENSLFALNRYLEIKENNKDGVKRYVAVKAHMIALYLLDCGYSGNVAKARQIAFTTTYCGWAINKCSVSVDFSAKYISENETKAERTFQEKVKYPYSRFPQWMREEAISSQAGLLHLGEKTEEKGVISGSNSLIEVLAPTATAVASSTPTVTFVDEKGQIDKGQEIRGDVIPTMKGLNPKTGRQEVLRMLWEWGTGGEMSSAGGLAFQTTYMADMDEWNSGGPCLIIPLKFNVWYRPGWTKADQEEEYRRAYAIRGPGKDKARTKFHQSYPITLDDIFKMSGNTLLPQEWINDQKKRIDASGVDEKVIGCGYFEPVYDTKEPAPEGSDVPFKIIGAHFMPCDRGDSRVSTWIFDAPRKWLNRYFQGTDPIASNSGYSDMASAIFDGHWHAPVAITIFRSSDYRQAYLQNMLLGLYYGQNYPSGACPELVEANIGAAYREYKTNKGYGKSLVYESELPEMYQSSKMSVGIGIDNKGLRNGLIITELKNIFLTYGHNIYIRKIFEQLGTFVEKPSGKGTTWEPADRRSAKDDVLFALVYSYICYLCFMHKKPQEIEQAVTQSAKKIWKLIRQANGQMKGEWVKPTVKQEAVTP
jgi:hypothetical protein